MKGAWYARLKSRKTRKPDGLHVHICCHKHGVLTRISHQILLQTWELDELYGVIRKYRPEAIIVNNTGLDEPEPFLYGHGRIARVAKIQCEKLQNVRTIYES